MGVPASFVCAARKAILVNWLQDLFPEVAEAAGIRGIRGGTAACLRRLRNQSIRRSGATVVIGERMRARLIEEGVSPAQLVVIPNWADGDCLLDVQSASELRKAWGLHDKFVVGYSGNAGRVHDLATVVDAMELLRGEEQIAFLFVGGGKHRDWVESEVRRRGLENVQFQPYQPRERLMSSLRVADVHLVTLLPAMEGLVVPSKFYGVAAAGRPTLFVGDPDGEIARTVIDSVCGLVVPSGGAAALASAILTLRDQPELLALHGRNARAVFTARFDKKHALSRWTGLIERVGNDKPMK
jgi:glycosyltransferase involved in cell wall biosynthesis